MKKKVEHRNDLRVWEKMEKLCYRGKIAIVFRPNILATFIMFLFFTTAIFGCATQIGSPLQLADISTMNNQKEIGDYVLGAGDSIDVKFFHNPQLNEEVLIRPDGKISLQLIGDVIAAGLTPAKLASKLSNSYFKALRKSPNDDYVLGIGDNIAIKFFYNPQLNEEVLIRPDGKISLQLIGDAIAAGLTPAQLGSQLKSKYSKTLNSSSVDHVLGTSEDYVLGTGDTIAVKFYYTPQLNDEVVVRSDGKISLQLIGHVVAAGLTPTQLESQLKSKYAKELNSSDEYYVLGVGDNIALKFFYNPQFDDEVIIRPDGKISLQLIGDVIVAGHTPAQLSSRFTSIYSKKLKSPKVTVTLKTSKTPNLTVIVQKFINPNLTVIVRNFISPELTVIVKQFAAQKVYVGGEVSNPKIIPLNGRLRAFDAVIQAGGALNTAQLKNVVLVRYSPNKTLPPKAQACYPCSPSQLIRHTSLNKIDVYSLNLNRVIRGEIPDIILKPYDIIYLPKTTIARVDLFVEQYLFNLLPPNVGFSFPYNLNTSVSVGN